MSTATSTTTSPPTPTSASTSNPYPAPNSDSDSSSAYTLSLLLGKPLRILLSDNRTLQGQLESIDSTSLLLSNTLETRAPPTTDEERIWAENKDRYYPRSDPHAAFEIRGLGIGREIGAVVVGLKDLLRVELDEAVWRELGVDRTAEVM